MFPQITGGDSAFQVAEFQRLDPGREPATLHGLEMQIMCRLWQILGTGPLPAAALGEIG